MRIFYALSITTLIGTVFKLASDGDEYARFFLDSLFLGGLLLMLGSEVLGDGVAAVLLALFVRKGDDENSD